MPLPSIGDLSVGRGAADFNVQVLSLSLFVGFDWVERRLSGSGHADMCPRTVTFWWSIVVDSGLEGQESPSHRVRWSGDLVIRSEARPFTCLNARDHRDRDLVRLIVYLVKLHC